MEPVKQCLCCDILISKPRVAVCGADVILYMDNLHFFQEEVSTTLRYVIAGDDATIQ